MLFTLVIGCGATEFKRLEDVYADEPSPANTAYVLKRCSSVYLALSGLMLVDGGSAEMSNSAAERSREFLNISERWSARHGLNFRLKGTSRLIQEIAMKYSEEMQANLVATGNRIGGVFKEDMDWCGEVYTLYTTP